MHMMASKKAKAILLSVIVTRYFSAVSVSLRVMVTA
jgi:hypothetical protein